jgi:hypothetical protein
MPIFKLLPILPKRGMAALSATFLGGMMRLID